MTTTTQYRRILLITVHLLLLFSTCVAAETECKRLFVAGKIMQAHEYCLNQAEQFPKDSTEYHWSQLILFDIETHRADHEKAYQTLLGLSQIVATPEIRYEVLRRQGHYFRVKKRYAQAKSYYEDALILATQLQSDLRLSKSYNDIGLILMKDKEYPQSIDYLLKSLKIKRQLGDPKLLRTTITNLGLLFHQTEDYETAVEHYKEAEKILINQASATNTVDRFHMIHLYSYLAAAYNKWGHYELGGSYLKQFNQQISELTSEQEIHNRLVILVELLIDINSHGSARTVLQKLNTSPHKHHNSGDLYYFNALIELHFNNTEQAKVFAQKALSEMELHLTSEHKADLFLLLATLADESGDHQQAFQWFQRHHEVKLGEIKNKINQDFKIKQYQQALDNNRLNYVESQLDITRLEKKNYQTLLILLVSLSALLLLFLRHQHQKKVAENQNLLLNKDIEKHKELYDLLAMQPISFRNLFGNKPYHVVVTDKASSLVYSNKVIEEENKFRLLSFMTDKNILSSMAQDLHPDEKIPVTKMTVGGHSLSGFSHINRQDVLAGEYTIWSFCGPDDRLENSSQVNAINQFEYYLKQHNAFDALHTRKIIVDCMNMCLDSWTKSTSSNRVEFADQSGAWKINIDDGRLRTRSLDRYLSLSTIPKQPRIKQVIKSCTFMLNNERIPQADKSRIGFYLDRLQLKA